MILEPLGNFIVVEPIEKPKETASGIVIPDSAQKPASLLGTVIAVGPGEYNPTAATVMNERKPISVKVGDKVLIRRQRFEEYEMPDKKIVYLGNEENIWAKVTNA